MHCAGASGDSGASCGVGLSRPSSTSRQHPVVGARRADVAPVAVHRYAEDGLVRREQQREEVVGKIKRRVLRHIGHRPRGDDIDAGVDEIGHYVRPVRFFDEVAYIALPVLQNEPVLQRLCVRVERDRHSGAGALVLPVELQQVKAARRVAADDEKIIPAVKVAARAHGARRSARLGLDAVAQVHAVAAAVAAVLLNGIRAVTQRCAHVREAVAPQQLEQPVEHRTPTSGTMGFGSLPVMLRSRRP